MTCFMLELKTTEDTVSLCPLKERSSVGSSNCRGRRARFEVEQRDRKTDRQTEIEIELRSSASGPTAWRQSLSGLLGPRGRTSPQTNLGLLHDGLWKRRGVSPLVCVMCERVVSSLAPETLKGTNVVGRGGQKTLSCSRQVKFRGHLDLCTPQCFDCPRKQTTRFVFQSFCDLEN